MFLAHCVWWLAWIIGREQGLANYIDNIQSRIEVSVTSDASPDKEAITTGETDKGRQDMVLRECEEFLRDSRRLHDLANFKKEGSTKTGRIHPLRATNHSLGIAEKKENRNNDKITGISMLEIQGRKDAGECLRCAWPADRKGTHQVKNCVRPIKLDKETASYPKSKNYQMPAVASYESLEEDNSSNEEENTSLYQE
jgi:hypothetical protein